MSSITTSEDCAGLHKAFDPAFKLFGRTIPFADTDGGEESNSRPNGAAKTYGSGYPAETFNSKPNGTTETYESSFFSETYNSKPEDFDNSDPVCGKPDNSKLKDASAQPEPPCLQDVGDEAPHSEDESSLPDEGGYINQADEEKNGVVNPDGHPRAGPEGEGLDVETPSDLPTDDSQIDASGEQTLKRPDKVIPCPRCKSLDTKFCYYNNYNINQPRHFCKNCQRYWTAGGSLRNVPVGAGRRKSKNSSNQRNVIAEGLLVRGDPPEQLLSCTSSPPVVLNRSTKMSAAPRQLTPLDVHSIKSLESPPSSTVLSFGQEIPKPFTHRSEVLQWYKPEMSESQEKLDRKLDRCSSAGAERLFETKHYSAEKACRNVNSDPGNEAIMAAFWPCPQPVGDHYGKCGDTSQAQIAKTEGGSSTPITSIPDATPACANTTAFSFVTPPWHYGANLGWANMAPISVTPNVLQGVGIQNPCSNSAGGGLQPAPNSASQPPWAAVSSNQFQIVNPIAQSTGGGLQPAPNSASQPPWTAVSTNQFQIANPIAQSPLAGTVGNPWAGIPWPFLQNPLWGSAWGGAWTMPWAAPAAAAAAAAAIATAAAAAAAAATANAARGSQVLRKRPRESAEVENGNSSSPLIPKTLRIDDPGDAARSSIWTALGLASRSDCFPAGSIFTDFQLKQENKEMDDPNAQTRNSNPAARERAVLFQESSLSQQNIDVQDT